MALEAWLERVEQHFAALAPEERDEVTKGLNSDSMIRVVDVDSALIAGGLELGRLASKMNV